MFKAKKSLQKKDLKAYSLSMMNPNKSKKSISNNISRKPL